MSEPQRLSERLQAVRERFGEAPEGIAAPLPDPPTLAADARRRIAGARWEALIPPRFAAARLDDLDGPLRARLDGWAAEPERNLVLSGPVGSGKTYAAVAALRPLVEQRRWGAGFWPVVRLLDQLRPNSESDPYAAAVEADVLLLDDLGAERATDWTGERLYSLVNDRWLAELPTIVTTNLAPPELTAAAGERLASRLLGGALTVRLSGHDRRMIR